MLRELRVKNFALLESVDLKFADGMSVFTGETGAGKSLLLDAITLLLGAKARGDLVRAGSDAAEVEGVFDLSGDAERRRCLEDLGFPLDPDEGFLLLVRREVSSKFPSRNRVWIQGKSATRTQLQETLGTWIEVSGQHEFLKLNRDGYALDTVDQFGNLSDERRLYGESFVELQAAEQELGALREAYARRDSEIEFLKFQIKEFEKAGVSEELATEEKRLGELRIRLSNVDRIQKVLNEAAVAVDGSDENVGALHRISQTQRELQDFIGAGDDFNEILRMSRDAEIILAELSRAIQVQLSKVQADPQSLEEADERLSLVNRLKRKHNVDADGLAKMYAEFKERVVVLENSEDRLMHADAKIQVLKKALWQSAQQLHHRRTAAAMELSKLWQKDLRALGMPKAVLSLEVAVLDCLDAHGITAIQAMFSANQGEGLKPLAKVASGGELSRILLSLKHLLAQRAEVAVYLFDEVDAGLGGETAKLVAQRLQKLSRNNQVLVVTHLAQIAALASTHIGIEKSVDRGRTKTEFCVLDQSMREHELARMLGSAKSKSALVLAREMLKGELN